MGSAASLPSPYLARLGLEEAVPPPPLAVSSIEQARRIYLRRDGCPNDPIWSNVFHAWAVEKRREGVDPYDEYDGVVGLPIDPTTRIFSASQLTALGQCPFKWFADKVLGLAELKEAEEDLSPRLKGNLYHRSLELVFKVLGAADLCQASVEKLEVSFLQAEQDLEFPTLPAWNARRSEHIKVLSHAMQKSDFWQPGAEIFVETDFEGEWYGLKVRGRMDRVDRTSQGLVLFDYKTSSQPPMGVKDDFGKASLDIQMPLYIHMAQTTLFPGEQVEGAYYYSLTKGKKLYKAQPNEQTLKAIAHRVKAHLETGNYPVDPDIEQQACRYCPYDLICRKGARNSRKGGAV